jgi:hypothetical protein
MRGVLGAEPNNAGYRGTSQATGGTSYRSRNSHVHTLRGADKLKAASSVKEGAAVARVPVLLSWRAGLGPEHATVAQPLKLWPEEVLCTGELS